MWELHLMQMSWNRNCHSTKFVTKICKHSFQLLIKKVFIILSRHSVDIYKQYEISVLNTTVMRMMVSIYALNDNFAFPYSTNVPKSCLQIWRLCNCFFFQNTAVQIIVQHFPSDGSSNTNGVVLEQSDNNSFEGKCNRLTYKLG